MPGSLEPFIVIVFIALLAWGGTTFIPMPSVIRTIILGVAAGLCVVILVQAFGGVDILQFR